MKIPKQINLIWSKIEGRKKVCGGIATNIFSSAICAQIPYLQRRAVDLSCKLKTPLAAAFFFSLLLSVSAARANEVIILKDIDIKPYRDAIEGFKSACGCSVKEVKVSDDNALKKIVNEHPDAVFTVGTRAFRKARALQNIPVIYAMVMPVELADPPENISGVSMDIAPKNCLAAMALIFPRAKRIGLLYDPERTGPFVRRAAAAAAAKGVSLITKTMSDPQQMPALLDSLRGRIDVLWMLPDATVVTPETIDYLMLFSFRNKIPLFSFSEKYVQKGAVGALKIDPGDMGAQAAEIAGALFDGEKGPVRVFARSARLVVNRKVGAKIGVQINDELVRDAEKIE